MGCQMITEDSTTSPQKLSEICLHRHIRTTAQTKIWRSFHLCIDRRTSLGKLVLVTKTPGTTVAQIFVN